MDKSASILNTKAGQVRSMHPHKFGLWLFMLSVTMIFVSLTSAYVVKKADGNWLIIDFPSLFQITTIIIVLSSVSIHFAYIAAKKNSLLKIRIGLVMAGVLAVAFTIGQWMSWGELVDGGVHFVGNAAGSFIYIFTGLHILHLLGGLIFLGVVIKDAFVYKVHSKSLVRIEMCTTYWHFLGGLWVFLYLFLIANN